VRSLQPSFALRDIHQILVHAGILWVTCAFDNAISIYDGHDWTQWYPRGKAASGPGDVNHFNSLTIFGNEICIVAHNRGSSELLFFELPDLAFTRSISLGTWAHNAWMHGKELMTCSSEEGCLMGVNGTRVNTGGFPRGIAYTNDEIYVGISERIEREDRDFSTAAIAVFDCEWRSLRTVTLPSEGMVLDLMPIDTAMTHKMFLAMRSKQIQFPVHTL
jgi:hypothetical protein